jgi:23S rRNA pseudouridine1911/1915/1917 synthase
MTVIYDDDDLIIVNKPADILSILDRFDTTKPSVVGYLRERYEKVMTVHRLDRETSGIMVFARNEAAHRNLSMQFEHKDTVQKIYYALLDGVLPNEEGIMDKSIGEHPTIPGKMMATAQGKPSLTLYKVVERFKHYTLAEAEIKTGRTHQIRVHFQSIGYPLAVDAVYGRKASLFLSEIKQNRFRLGKYEEERPLMQRTTLHAFRLQFLHPTTETVVSFEADPPKDFAALLNQLRKWGK